MKESFYGDVKQVEVRDALAAHVEEIAVLGYTVVPDLLSEVQLQGWREKIDRIYERQEREFGRDALERIRELDVCRAPLLYDFSFLELATQPTLLAIVRRFLGDWFILNLQNVIINRAGTDHHQASWHRDLPYQNWVISRPLAINVLFAIDKFSPETGGTQVVPCTHKLEVLPSDRYIDRHRLTATAAAGSAIVFDSMLFHRAGTNRSRIIRRAVNHLYTVPIIKQQYDFPRALAGRELDLPGELARLLGFTCQVPLDDRAWRSARTARMAGGK